MMKKVIELKTTNDLEMSVQTCKVALRDSSGKHPQEDEIAFLIHGYNSQKEKNIEEVVTISKQEAKHLATILNKLAN